MRLTRTYLLVLVAAVLLVQLAAAQRDESDDFDDSGFDDSGYGTPQTHDTESSNQNPSNYSPTSEEELDDDDDADETRPVAQLAMPQHPLRYRRSTSEPAALSRHRRHSKYIGPVYTYVKTDKLAHYKWGVKHKVGKHSG